MRMKCRTCGRFGYSNEQQYICGCGSDNIKIIYSHPETWKTVLSQHTPKQQKKILSSILRTRKRVFRITINGTTVVIRRAVVRDYLKGKYPNVTMNDTKVVAI